ncbi:MAG: hypothetical protein ABIP44_01465 [Pseudoxanthomonas sp.]
MPEALVNITTPAKSDGRSMDDDRLKTIKKSIWPALHELVIAVIFDRQAVADD